MSRLVAIITADDEALRDRSIDEACRGLDAGGLLAEAAALDAFRRGCPNLYRRVRALFFLAAIHRYHLPAALGERPDAAGAATIPAPGVALLLARRYDEAIDLLLACAASGPSAGLSSALAAAYRDLGLQTLANQVRQSVRAIRGNQWMFRVGHPVDHPLRVRRELVRRGDGGAGTPFPVLHESTPVRMDLSHAGWSDIFFLGMDCPEAARVLNISVDLGVHGRDPAPRPPVEAFFRVIDEPILRLTSIDLDATADIADVAEVFDFGRDHLGLLKAAVIASGIVPPGIEGSGASLAEVFAVVVGPGLGLELVSSVNGIPKGSRLAVSTNLLASLIAVCMRATGQARSLSGGLDEGERRLVAARAILGEWLGGSGGGWQDSGGVWPAAKLIRGVAAVEGTTNPERASTELLAGGHGLVPGGRRAVHGHRGDTQPYPTTGARQGNRRRGARGGESGLAILPIVSAAPARAGVRRRGGRRSALAVADAGTHAALLLPQFAPTLARLLDTHARLPLRARAECPGVPVVE